ncbi:class I SAM-dependent methyltransferase [Roseivirga misakiensis]|uniref:Methyltransferase domain-containing protein n=1 Tax=Roseivirga misakiensis TaxID=1563681 RepID=A0A1E5T630_9BACT|nr:class I SAM-dependent methyltransferase [Roseivirga misakiensis]OEK06757.1 hypothetical protein BFP71_03595 [Roseivirga misakiensis]
MALFAGEEIAKMKIEDFPFLDEYANLTGYDKQTLLDAYSIESHYHKLLLEETSAVKRKGLYNELYNQILPLYAKGKKDKKSHLVDKAHMVAMFNKEIKVGSVIDLGCGNGSFLKNIHQRYPEKRLVGVDVYRPEAPIEGVEFIAGDVVSFRMKENFDTVISDNVIEHLVPEDFEVYLKSVNELLNAKGKLIIILPNRLFGPSDITRIIDFTYSGKVEANGGHVNESTYTDIISVLRRQGFDNIKTVLPIPKLKYGLLKNVRVSPSPFVAMENSKFWLWLFRRIKVKGKCPIRFTVTLVCEKTS